jgi:hypothetical protein
MSDIAKNVIPFPSPSIQNIIAEWERKSYQSDPHTFLVEMASALAQNWRNIDKDATAEREESKQAIIRALDRRAKQYLVTASGAAIFDSARAGLFPVKTPTDDSPTLRSVRASDIKMAAVDWLWPNRFAIGELGLLVGLPDEGKGQILCDMAARVTRGSDWPCGEGRAQKGKVLFLTAEDSLEKTVKPRLAAAGADMDHVEIIQMVEDGDNGKSRMFSLVTDLGLLRDKIKQVGDVKLILIDPIASYLAGNGKGKVDTFRTVDVRAAISPVVALADELKVAIVGVMHFNKKTDVDNVMLRVSDSLAFPAISRHVYGVVDDPKNSRKLFVRGKNNIADRAMSDKTLAYHFEARDVGVDQKTGEAIIAPHIVMEG